MSVGNISELIAKKNYAKAIEAIRAQLKAGKHNPQLHMQLADVLVLAKKPNEAIQILVRVADEFAHDGFEAKAIAVLKKIDRLEPGRPDVQSKMRALVKKSAAPPAPPPRSSGGSGGGGGGFELGIEEIGFEAPGSSGPISVPARPGGPLSRAPEPELPSFGIEEAGPELGMDSGPALDLGLDARPAEPPPPPPPAPKPAPRPPAPKAAPPAPKPPAPKPAPPKAPPKPVPAPVQDLDFGFDDAEEEAPAAEEPMILLEPEPEPMLEALPELEPEPALEAEPEVEPEPEAESPLEISDIQLEPEAEGVPVEAAADEDGGGFDDLFTQELMSAFDEAFTGSATAGAAAAVEAPRPAVVRGDLMGNPIFQGFSPDELVAVVEGLNLLTFEPGDIIISQGDPGNSLFILTTGTVKAFVNKKHIRDLDEGSFFGEVAILTGQPRTATITAKTYCELLELDRGTLDAISISHPHVTQVLQEFYEKRQRGEA
jgi:hypothetical protein